MEHGPRRFSREAGSAQEGQDEEAARACPACGGRLGVKLSRVGGGFIGCSGYPACGFTRPLALPEEGAAPDTSGARGVAYCMSGSVMPRLPRALPATLCVHRTQSHICQSPLHQPDTPSRANVIDLVCGSSWGA
jgi:ssDNA-binding Zn-finger/Zn-ribbon topoisomerase 1